MFDTLSVKSTDYKYPYSKFEIFLIYKYKYTILSSIQSTNMGQKTIWRFPSVARNPSRMIWSTYAYLTFYETSYAYSASFQVSSFGVCSCSSCVSCVFCPSYASCDCLSGGLVNVISTVILISMVSYQIGWGVGIAR